MYSHEQKTKSLKAFESSGPEVAGPGTSSPEMSRPELPSARSCGNVKISIPWHPKLGNGIAEGDGAVTSLTSDSTGYCRMSTPTTSESLAGSMNGNESLTKAMQHEAEMLPQTMS